MFRYAIFFLFILSLQISFSQSEDQSKNGAYLTNYKSGAIFEKGKLKNGKLKGKFVAYFEDGSIQAKGKYKDGKKNGKWEYFHPNGQVSKVGKAIMDAQEGEWLYYDENGKLFETIIFKDGKPTK